MALVQDTSHGVVYTRQWLVDAMLDMAGYTSDRNLYELRAVDPAAGDGAFFLEMVRRLLDTTLNADALRDAVRAYELDAGVARDLSSAVRDLLCARGISERDADHLSAQWVVAGDYLLDVDHEAEHADVVVGNPPYVKHDHIPQGLREQYRTRFSTMVGRSDLYIAFIEASLRHVGTSGRVVLVVPDRWVRSAYGSELRRFIAEEHHGVSALVRLDGTQPFERQVAAHPVVVVVDNTTTERTIVTSCETAAPDGHELANIVATQRSIPTVARVEVLERWSTSDERPWPSLDGERLAVLRRLEAEHPTLEASGVRTGVGVATGKDAVFIVDEHAPVEHSRLLPLAVSSDVAGNTWQWSGHYLVNPWDNDGRLVALDDYPLLTRYLRSHERELRRRAIASKRPDQWYRTIDKLDWSLVRRPKLYAPDIAARLHTVLDTSGTYPHSQVHWFTSDTWDLEALGGLLLSDVVDLFVRAYFPAMQHGFYQFNSMYLRLVHLPDPARIPATVVDRLRSAFRAGDERLASAAARDAYHLAVLD